jgi:hydroxymethylpyrimidine pyrophosphatase-like HAD family hydrolase
MFEAVDVSLAVANASPAIKAVCDRTIERAEDGGVGRFILTELVSREDVVHEVD